MESSPASPASATGILRLRPDGPERALPEKWLGYNSPAPYNIPIEEPALASALRALRPHFLRFPGGTVSNYYQWRTGHLLLGEHPDSEVYRQYATRSRELHPKGVFIEQYVELAGLVGADLIVVPNLETSSEDDQAAWFAQMGSHGYVPSRIEMGNEFFLALMMNPVTLARFPDWSTTISLTRRYVEALRPYISSDARIAVQSAGSTFHNPDRGLPNPYAADPLLGERVARRERQWDDDMKPESWFHAVTLHLYPTIEGSAGAGSLSAMPENATKIFSAGMARVDEGYDRVLSDTVARMPGKEIWISEWGAFEPLALMHGVPVSFTGIWFHMIARAIFAMLRCPQVTVATNHSLFCDGNLMSAFRRADDGALVRINATDLIAWFCEASRGPDAHYQRIAVEGATHIAGEGTVAGEGFRDVDACALRRGAGHTLFVHNALSHAKRMDLSAVAGADAPLTVDAIETPDLLATLERGAPPVLRLPANRVLEIPGYSIARVAWSA